MRKGDVIGGAESMRVFFEGAAPAAAEEESEGNATKKSNPKYGQPR
jgi:hypothetical protein